MPMAMSMGMSMAEDPLQSLAEKAARGDQGAFADLYGLTARRVYGLCRHMLASREAAEDATSEVFLKVHRAFQSATESLAGSYNPDRRFLPWLLSVAGNYCVDQLRRRGLETRIFATPKPDEDGDSGFWQEMWSESWTSQSAPNIADRLVADAGRAEVRQALAALSDQYRIPLVLRYDSELSYDEIAATMGLKRNHVATLIFRAKKELRSELRKVARASRDISSVNRLQDRSQVKDR
jgi:RNA polymerase sigma-70 factor (ECF subfamily)